MRDKQQFKGMMDTILDTFVSLLDNAKKFKDTVEKKDTDELLIKEQCQIICDKLILISMCSPEYGFDFMVDIEKQINNFYKEHLVEIRDTIKKTAFLSERSEEILTVMKKMM